MSALAAERLRLLVRHAREESPFYARHYAAVPRDAPPASLPPVTKRELMGSFDDWCTDRAVSRAAVEAFMADRARIGAPFLGRYHVWKSSGTTGSPGLFVQDAHAMAVYELTVATQLGAALLAPAALARAMGRLGRAALVVATGDHFASIASWEYQRRMMPSPARASFDVAWPLERIVRALEAFDPAFLAAYPSMLRVLAVEKRAGRLAITPSLAWSGGETLSPAVRRLVSDAFGCRVMNEYGASECLSIARECEAGWMHAHPDWVVLEGVDAHGAPVAPGSLSHTVLVTNLANHVQPVIRYDIGDRMRLAAHSCPCGRRDPAFRIEGRDDASLVFRRRDGSPVTLVPLALSTVVEEAGVDSPFQIVRTSPSCLALRLEHAARARAPRVRAALRDYLASQGLAAVRVALDSAPPRPDAASGKLRAVLAHP